MRRRFDSLATMSLTNSVAATTTAESERPADRSLLNRLDVIARGAVNVVGLHARVRQATSLIRGYRRARRADDARGDDQRENERLSAHRLTCITGSWAWAAVLCFLVPVRAHAQSPARRSDGGSAATSASPSTPIDTTLSAEFAAYTDTNAVTVFTPSVAATVASRGGAWSANGHYLTDIVSAASVDIVSSASSRWTEVRHEAALSATYQPRSVGATISAVASREPDYLSFGFGALVRWELGQKNVNPILGYSFSHDTAGRTGTPFSVFALQLARHQVTLGTELVLDRATTVFLSADGVLELGDSSKPYRFLPLFAPAVAPQVQPGASIEEVNALRLPGRIKERVPSQRARFALSARFARRYRNSTWTLFQRLYADDWGMWGTTADLRYLSNLNSHWEWWFQARGHAQTAVWFWKRAYTAEFTDGSLQVPEYRSGDRELSPLFSLTAGAGLRWIVKPSAMRSASLSLQFDETVTDFRDALYIDGRLAHLAILQAEVPF